LVTISLRPVLPVHAVGYIHTATVNSFGSKLNESEWGASM